MTRPPAITAMRRTRSSALVFAAISSLCLMALAGCRRQAATGPAATPAGMRTSSRALFRDVAAQAGIHFAQTNGADPAKPLFIETTPAGCAFLDYDNDGWLDILLIQSGSPTPGPGYVRPHCALYHNNGDGTFTDVTAGSGLDKDLGYAHGVAVGDYDNDGFDDIFITSYPRNFLFHNRKGAGRFDDVTEAMGLGGTHSTGYATSAAFGDYDNDGRLDLYVCYYCPWSPAADHACKDSQGRVEYCSPDVYPLDTHVLYHNEGSRFVDVSGPSGISKVKGRGLAVAFLDYDEDGKQDIFVANDLSGNMLWHNQGGGKFVEKGSEVGCRYGANGGLMAAMGIAVGDYDHSGHESLVVTNFQDLPNMVFRNSGQGYMEDYSVRTRVGPVHLPYLSFGCEFLDYDADGWPDLLTANGHVQMKGNGLAGMRQPKQLLHNEGNGSFQEVTDAAALGDLRTPTVARGLAVGDFDNDGHVDALFNNQNGPAQLFRNEYAGPNHWVSFKTVGVKSNRDGLHTRFVLTVGGAKRIGTVRAGSSYLSVSDRRVYFGLGSADRVEKVEVEWPSGTRDTLTNVAADQSYIVTEGKGITGRLPRAGERTAGARR